MGNIDTSSYAVFVCIIPIFNVGTLGVKFCCAWYRATASPRVGRELESLIFKGEARRDRRGEAIDFCSLWRRCAVLSTGVAGGWIIHTRAAKYSTGSQYTTRAHEYVWHRFFFEDSSERFVCCVADCDINRLHTAPPTHHAEPLKLHPPTADAIVCDLGVW